MVDEGLDGFSLSKNVREKLKSKQLLKEELALGKTAQQILEISDANMQAFYEAAYRLFEHDRVEEAANAFFFLATLNPFHHSYWLGVGMCAQLVGDLEAAVDAYELAALSEVESPVPYFYLAKCLFALNERETSIEALDIALEYAGDKPEFRELKNQAALAKKLLLGEE